MTYPGRDTCRRRLKRSIYLTVLAVSSGLLPACQSDDGLRPGALRFGQVGEIRVTVVAPLIANEWPGELQQILTWTSDGRWQLRESVSYRGLPGDEQLRSDGGQGRAYASAYAALITQLNETEGLRLFVPDLDPTLKPVCSLGETQVTLRIRDQIRDSLVTWTRCTQGTLGTLSLSEAGPDLQAVRVIQASTLVRDFTVGAGFRSAYVGTVPFGTLDRGEDSGARPTAPRVFVSTPPGSLSTPSGWVEFWRAHKADPTASPPLIDWRSEMVLVAAVGERLEAGDSVEIRRILQTDRGTEVEVFERVPGDFCSPAARLHYPIHIVVAPRTRDPITFREVVKERVPCGI